MKVILQTAFNKIIVVFSSIRFKISRDLVSIEKCKIIFEIKFHFSIYLYILITALLPTKLFK